MHTDKQVPNSQTHRYTEEASRGSQENVLYREYPHDVPPHHNKVIRVATSDPEASLAMTSAVQGDREQGESCTTIPTPPHDKNPVSVLAAACRH